MNIKVVKNAYNISIKNFKKYYHKVKVLEIKEYNFLKGYTYLIVGENGSGKSTLIKSIVGIINYEGIINTFDNIIGYLPERFPEISLIKGYTFLNNLLINNKNANKSEILVDFSKYFDLNLNKNISSLSKGNLQKLMIIQAIMNKANIIIFDEPLNGLDSVNQNKFIKLIRMMKSNDRTVIITTHYPKYYTNIYDKVIYIESGYIREAKGSI